MSRPAKVAWISCVGEKGGAEVTMLHTFRVLDRTRFIPAMVQLRPGPLEAEATAAGAEVFVLKQHRMRNLPAVFQATFFLFVLFTAPNPGPTLTRAANTLPRCSGLGGRTYPLSLCAALARGEG